MNAPKTILASILLATASAFACWFTADNFNGNYIAGVNNYAPHYAEAATIAEATYRNGQGVALPLTVFIKVHRRANDQEGEQSGFSEVTKATLQYRVRRSGSWLTNWVTVRSFDNPAWDMNVDRPVPLFGSNSIDPKNIARGDEIYIRYYVTDGVYQSGDLSDSLDGITVLDTETQATFGYRTSGWTPPFVFRVIYNGKRKIGF